MKLRSRTQRRRERRTAKVTAAGIIYSRFRIPKALRKRLVADFTVRASGEPPTFAGLMRLHEELTKQRRDLDPISGVTLTTAKFYREFILPTYARLSSEDTP